MTPEKIPIRAQVEEARRLALYHQHTYPIYVRRRRMRPAAAEYYLRTQRAILATLEWVQDNEALLKAAVAAVQRLPRQEERERNRAA